MTVLMCFADPGHLYAGREAIVLSVFKVSTEANRDRHKAARPATAGRRGTNFGEGRKWSPRSAVLSALAAICKAARPCAQNGKRGRQPGFTQTAPPAFAAAQDLSRPF